MKNSDAHEVQFVVRRFLPGDGARPYWQRYPVPVHPGMTVLDGLHYIREELDATLAWRSSCRMGVCGSCGMVVQGQPRLACSTQILEAANAPSLARGPHLRPIGDMSRTELWLEPLWNFGIVRDLVSDLEPMFRKHASVHPYIVDRIESITAASMPHGPRLHPGVEARAVRQGGRGYGFVRGHMQGPEPPAVESRQLPEALTAFLQFSGCIKCGACMAACPTLATHGSFLGPMPLTAAQRYNADSRDRGFALRRERVDAAGGAFHCHYAGECSRVCPKGVDPARAIQLLKRDLVRR